MRLLLGDGTPLGRARHTERWHNVSSVWQWSKMPMKPPFANLRTSSVGGSASTDRRTRSNVSRSVRKVLGRVQ
jgi:hypothetical protein